jgi:hypothetical protein
MSDRLLKQCINIKCADAMKKSSVFEWHKRFEEGWEDVKDDERTGCLKTYQTDENVEKEDRETVRKILTEDLGIMKVSAKMTRILSDYQKQRRLDVGSDLSCQLAGRKKLFGYSYHR